MPPLFWTSRLHRNPLGTTIVPGGFFVFDRFNACVILMEPRRLKDLDCHWFPLSFTPSRVGRFKLRADTALAVLSCFALTTSQRVPGA
jgi:hypothetical protein